MYSIGVDFHKAYSHMTVVDAQGQVMKAGKVPNTQEAVHAFVVPYRDDAQAVLEATRNWTVMYDVLEREVQAVYLAHPLKVRAIAEARIKTDRIDSKILALLLRCDLLPTATSLTSKPRWLRSSKSGIQYTPVDSIATVSMPQRVSQSARTYRSVVKAPKARTSQPSGSRPSGMAA
jgi:hypothetical protein